MKLRHFFVSFLAITGFIAGCDESADKNLFKPTAETTEALCSDGMDNNINGLIDCEEESCKQFDHCKGDGTDKKEICDNEIDDDGDNKADCDDEDCATATNCHGDVQSQEICDNEIDDDGDSKADCDDEDCASAANCQSGEPKEICDNSTDDDGDNKVDCDDEDCASASNCQKTKEICDNSTDDDGDNKVDCDDEDCASASNCQKTKEICDNSADDDGDNKVDCDDEDCASAANCQGPKEICNNEKDDDDDDIIDCEDPDCASAAACAPKTLQNLKYKVGLISDIHIDTREGKDPQTEDLKNAVLYFRNNGVDFVASCGDVAEYEPTDYKTFHKIYQDNAYEPTGAKMRLFTSIGNHDYLQLYTVQENGKTESEWMIATKYYFDFFTGEDNEANWINGQKDMHFFEYDGTWNKKNEGGHGRNAFSKLSYWFEKDNDIYVVLSLDYGLDPHKADARASNLLDMNNQYVKQMKEYVADTAYDEAKEKNYNYQFYHPNALIWLKDIIENNTNKHIFVITHHFITHKAGNGVPYNDKVYYSRRRIWPYSTDPEIWKRNYPGANALSGLTFHFINKLNNKHKNVIWFSGHTHYQWEDSKYDSCLVFCNKEFDFKQPTGEETTPLVKNTEIDTVPDLKLYTRVNDKPKGLSAYNVHIPSLAKPKDMGSNETLYNASQGGLMEVYENGVRIKGISFKKESANNYENQVVVTKEIFFP